MFNFFRRSNNVPNWFKSSNADFNYFIEYVDKVRSELLPGYVFSDDKSALILLDESGKELKKLNLANIAGTCLLSSKRDWLNIIYKFLTPIKYQSFNEKELFEEVSKQIVVQLYPKEILEQTKIPLLYKEIIPETICVIAFDTPETIEFVRPDIIKKWNKNIDELYSISIENTKRILSDLTFQEVGHGSAVRFGDSNSPLTACSALFLDVVNDTYNENGILFSTPNRHSIITLELSTKDKFMKDLPFLGFSSINSYNDGPYPINPNIYWLKDGNFTKLNYNFIENKLNFYPSDEFVETMNLLT